jgi:hypothetical protein
VAFEAEDAVLFESAFEADGVAPDAVEYAAAPEAIEPIETTEPLEPIDEGLDALADLPLPAAADDRVLLQFSATVPHDLAELRRIAADNQW